MLRGILIAAAVVGMTVTTAEADVETGIQALQDKKYGEAFIAFEAAVTAGDPAGLYHMGAMHQAGMGGLPKSDKMALAFYRQAAKEGVPEAIYSVGLFHHKGMGGLLQNPGEAVDWYLLAAEKGSIAAQYNLAMMYATGEASTIAYGSNPDYLKSYQWFKILEAQMELDHDKAHIDILLEDVTKHMTAGQIERGGKAATEWMAKHLADKKAEN